jgi:putative sigma-54 modulation protein
MSDLKVSVTFRHIHPTDALKDYAEQKVRRIGKYCSNPSQAHVILAVDSKDSQVAEIALHTHGAILHSKDQHQDLYAAIDLVVDKIERQIKKQKDKNQLGRRRKSA